MFTSQEADVVAAIDDYAAKHSLANRGAVVRQVLSQLLDLRIAES